MKRLAISLILLTICSIVYCQTDDKKKDDQYVEKVKSLISFRPFANHHLDLLILDYPNSPQAPMLYRPATGLNVGGEFAFSFLHFNYQKNVPYFQPTFPDGSKPSHQRIGFDLGGNIFGMEMSFQKNRGFYLLNPTDYPYGKGDSFDQIKYKSSMTSTSFGLDFRFTFSSKLSANALFNQSERQLKSKGAFTLIFGDHFSEIQDANAFLPDSLKPFYLESATTNKIWVNTFHVMPGYGYIAVAGKWNIGLFLYSGSGIQLRKYYNEDGEKLNLRIPFIVKGRTGITYNGHNFYTRLTASGDLTSLGMKDANFRWMQSFIEFSIGLRFYGKE